ncbi:MAG: toll/interleukin-1 receptor domain-containing protein [Acidobacteriia bacterium]|nr:toll/interleukin-1 receptor domain-containing protein [Terriglobia bacterium]
MAKGTNVFISWSGSRSLHVAGTLRAWLPKVVQAAKPWMSEIDIDKGARGLEDLARALEDKKVGIICLTPENLNVPWLLFEAGALSKTIDDKTRLCTYLIGGLRPQDIKPPLGQFQATRAEKEETRKLVHAVNKAASEEPIAAADLNDLFDAMWPHVEKALKGLPPAPQGVQAERPVEDMVAEILELVRAEASRKNLLASFSGLGIRALSEPTPSSLREDVSNALAGALPAPTPTALRSLYGEPPKR